MQTFRGASRSARARWRFPLGEAHLSIVSEQIKKVFASIQPFEIFERYGFALLVSHRLLCHAHCFTSNSVLCRSILIRMQMPRFSASISSSSNLLYSAGLCVLQEHVQ